MNPSLSAIENQPWEVANDNRKPIRWWREAGRRVSRECPQLKDEHIPPEDCAAERNSFLQGFWEESRRVS